MEPLRLPDLFGTDRPVIGMVHLPALPGAPGSELGMDALEARAVDEADVMVAGGVDGLLVENYGDRPFVPEDVGEPTVAAMAVLTSAVRRAVGVPVGVNVLRNDARAALSVAEVAGASFVRVNVWTGARLTDQGILEGRAHEVLRLRRRLDSRVRVFADAAVKHSVPLGQRTPAEEVADAIGRGGADAVIVTGPATGRPPEAGALDAAREAAGGAPVLAGSGVTAGAVGEVLGRADGIVVGSALREDGRAGRPIDPERVRRFMDAVAAART